MTVVVECSDGDVRRLSAQILADAGDVQGLIDICEGQQWKNVYLREDEWTMNNTGVVCRQLGYAAPG